MTDPGQHHSTISQNRWRRFLQADVEWKLFISVVKQTVESGLIDGKTLFTDSTHIKANARKHSIVSKRVKDVPQDVVERSVQRHLQAMVEERALLDDDTEDDLAAAIEADRAAVGKQPLPQPPIEAEDRDEKPLSHA